MAYRVWEFETEGDSHRIELQHGYWSGKRLIRLDGSIIDRSSKFLDNGTTHTFNISNHECSIRVIYSWWRPLSFSYECTVDGKPVPLTSSEKPD
jgi:hypothetical protein